MTIININCNQKEEKICNKCKVTKELILFGKNQNICKDCTKIYRENHKEDKAQYDKNRRQERSIENQEQRAEYDKKYYQDHKEEFKQYHQDNKESITKRTRDYKRNRRKTDPAFKLRKNISDKIYKKLKLNNISKNKSITNYILYSGEDLKLYLESLFEPWMTWKNQGVYNSKTWNDNDPSTWKWNLDHIIPDSSFDYKSMDCQEFRDCWALSNLRPLSAKQNILEGNRRTPEEIAKIKYEIRQKLGTND